VEGAAGLEEIFAESNSGSGNKNEMAATKNWNCSCEMELAAGAESGWGFSGADFSRQQLGFAQTQPSHFLTGAALALKTV
jgi:hypothetical protein